MKLMPMRVQSDSNQGCVHSEIITHGQLVNTCSQNSVAEPSPAFPSRQPHPLSVSTLAEIHYVIVFGYPPDKYSVTAEYFKSIGDTTEPDPNTQITNCFRIGYRDFGEGMRAVKRNGEILSGSYMVGAKWAVSSIVRGC